jgi:glutamine cyclotransferase
MNRISQLLLVALAMMLTACAKKQAVPEKLGFQIVSVIPHDPSAYTQGLQLANGRLLESTGQYGQSSVRQIDPKTGAVLKKRNLPIEVFGEGSTLHGNELWVLTWKEKTAYVLDPENFRTLRTHTYEGEGWGLTSDGKELIMSDGSSTLKFRSFKDLSVTRSLTVTEQGRELKRLNELEYIKGEIFANIYMTDRIAKIDPKSGEVTAWLDLSGLRNQLPSPNRAEALNGIAFDETTGHLLITGKYWPQMFEIKLGK